MATVNPIGIDFFCEQNWFFVRLPHVPINHGHARDKSVLVIIRSFLSYIRSVATCKYSLWTRKLSTQTLIWWFHYQSSLPKRWNIFRIFVQTLFFPLLPRLWVLVLDLIDLLRPDDFSTPTTLSIVFRSFTEVDQEDARIIAELEIWLCPVVYTCFISLISQKNIIYTRFHADLGRFACRQRLSLLPLQQYT